MLETLSKNKIKWIRSLRLKKNRDLEQLFIVEGEKMVLELVSKHPELIDCIVSNNRDFSYNGSLFYADNKSMSQISSLKTPNQLLAVVKKNIKQSKESKFILVLDGVQDPGNMGTILRTADWFNIDEIICSENTVDIYNSKVVQSSMGAIFRIPTTYCNLVQYLQDSKHRVYGALLEGDNIYSKTFKREGIIIMGNEGKGISEEVKPFIKESIHIPRFGESESLNVAVSTAIILSEFSRS